MSEDAVSVPPIRVTRDVPLPWLLTIAGSVLVACATFYIDQQRQWDKQIVAQAAQTEAISKLTAKVEFMAAQLGGKDLKDVQHDLQISDLVRRVEQLENPRGRR